MARVLKWSHSFTCTPRIRPQRNEPYLPLPSQPKLVLIYRPEGMEGWVGLGGRLHTEINVRHRELNPDTVTQPSSNRARCRLTSLIEANALTTTPDHQTDIRTGPRSHYNGGLAGGRKCKWEYVLVSELVCGGLYTGVLATVVVDSRATSTVTDTRYVSQTCTDSNQYFTYSSRVYMHLYFAWNRRSRNEKKTNKKYTTRESNIIPAATYAYR